MKPAVPCILTINGGSSSIKFALFEVCGVGACVAANKIPGVRAALITDSFSAHQGVEDDDMNVMCLGESPDML
jgi:ribose 5-phosphate isomerase RpiB